MSQASENIAKQLANAANVRKLWQDVVINVKEYGAIGGTHDDTSAFQQAINYAISKGKSDIWIPPGTYMYTTLTNTEGITFYGDNVTLNGTTVLNISSFNAMRTRLDNIVAGAGSSNAEIVDARLPLIGPAYPTLKGRMDSERAALSARIDNLVINATGGNVAEVVDARQPESGSAFSTLKGRLDVVDAALGSTLALAKNPIAQVPVNTIPSSLLRNSTDAEKLHMANMGADVIAAMSGASPTGTIPGPGSVVTETIAAAAVTPGKTSYLIESSNKLNTDNVIHGSLDYLTGIVTASTTDWVLNLSIATPNNYYSGGAGGTITAAFYDASGVYITGFANLNLAANRKAPANAAYYRLGFTAANYNPNTAQLNISPTVLSVMPDYETYYIKSSKMVIAPSNLSADTPSYLFGLMPKGIITPQVTTFIAYGSNLFNRNAVTNGTLSITDGTVSAGTDFVMDYTPMDPNMYICSNPADKLVYYDKNKTFISGVANTAYTTGRKTPSNCAFIRFSATATNYNYTDATTGQRMQLNISPTPFTALPDYEDFGLRVPGLLGAARTSKAIISPPVVYSVLNDLTTNPYERSYSAELYIDHMLDKTDDKNVGFAKTKSDSYPFVAYGLTSAYSETTETIVFDSSSYLIGNVTVKHRRVKASTGSAKKAVVLCEGDSMTYDTISFINCINGSKFPYWATLKELNEYDKIDNGNTGFDVTVMGRNPNVAIDINYKGVTRTVRAGADGLGGYGLTTVAHHPYRIDPSAASWALLGLDVSTGQPYTGTQAQMDLIRMTPLRGYTDTPTNRFYDPNASGTVMFSILKYLERFRTRADDGTKLTLSSPTKGTEITTQQQLDDWEILTPTHFILQHGRNDELYPNAYQQTMTDMIAKIKAELPSIIIGISIPPDKGGTMFPNRYTNIMGTDTQGVAQDQYRLPSYEIAKRVVNNFGNMEASNVYLIPSYFVQPTAKGMGLAKFDTVNSYDGRTYYYPHGDTTSQTHVSGNAHKAWAYQMYGWLKWTLK